MESYGMQSFVWLIKSMKPIHVDISVVPSLTAFVMFPFINIPHLLIHSAANVPRVLFNF